jgi:NADPH-dependent curcumin reductase CurA
MDALPVPDPGFGQILVKARWLSVDPYMRGRMSPATNYTKGVEIGEVMQGGGVGEVVASNHPKVEGRRHCRIHELRLAGMVSVDTRRTWPRWRE